MKLFILILLNITIIKIMAKCSDIPININVTRDDYGAHTNQTYEYWWSMGVLEADSINGRRTFGYLFGIDRCSYSCNNYMSSISIVDMDNNIIFNNNIYFDKPDLSIKINSNILKIDRFSVRKSNNDFILSGELSFTDNSLIVMDLYLTNTKGDIRTNPTTKNQMIGVHVLHPALIASGTLMYNNISYLIKGQSFIDHFWTNKPCSQMIKYQWKWFFIQLDNNVQIMIDNMNGLKLLTLIHPNKTVQYYERFHVIDIKYWISPNTKIKYPFINNIIADDIDLIVKPLVDDNEFMFHHYPLFYE